MTTKETQRLVVMDRVLQGLVTVTEATELLGLGRRQVFRLKARMRQYGAAGLVHQNRGRSPAHTLEEEVRQQIVALYQSPMYQGSNHCHFAELLQEREGIGVSRSTVRRILRQAGVAPVKPRRRPKAHRPRPRKPQPGLLWQIDASPFPWFEERAPACALLAAIDDATGVVVGACFRPHEDLQGYFEVMRQGIGHYGVPVSLYSDRHTIFRSPKAPPTLEQQLAGFPVPRSQFGQALDELSITHILAITPQAKGRVERLWQTLQDRLTIELRLRHVSTIDEANQILPALIDRHNRRFQVSPSSTAAAYRTQPDRPLELLFCLRHWRTLSPNGTVSWFSQTYALHDPSACRHQPIQVRQTTTGELFALVDDHLYPLQPIPDPPKPEPSSASTTPLAKPPNRPKPAANHPWRRNWPSSPHLR